MAKDVFYFPHDYHPISDPKMCAMVAEYGAAGYGLYWRIVEMLHENENHMLELQPYVLSAIAKQMNTTSDFLMQFISDCANVFCLILLENNVVKIDRVFRNIQKRTDLLDKRKAAGSKGGQASAKQRSSKRQANSTKGKERKGKEIKEITLEASEEFLMFLKWIENNSPKVAKMKEPFSERQFDSLTKKYPKEIIQSVLMDMHNKSDLLKKYDSAFLTCNNWCKRRQAGN